uniref:DNA helicase n=1 Tax=Angiostrongylus cantonensis TaxID=6313 RepID=A0A0K0CV69_ANGCA
MMVRIITALTKKLNLLAESPTGTGKTLALLTSSCAWLDDDKRRRWEALKSCPIHGKYGDTTMNSDDSEFFTDFQSSPHGQQDLNSDSLASISTENSERRKCSCLPKTRIYYGTRTHKQISQVVKEFSRLPYGGVLSHTILASREQSCINKAARESQDVSSYCKELISSGGIGCRHKDAMKRRFENARNGAVTFDIEELVSCLSSMPYPICPYFASTRVLTQDAEIIFCPFSYLIDPVIRNSSDVHLKNSVVILDEAHNIEDICREAASFTFCEKELLDALSDLRENEESTLTMIEKRVSDAELMDGVDKEAANVTIENHTQDLKCVTMLVQLVDDILKWFHDSASQLLEKFEENDMERFSQTRSWLPGSEFEEVPFTPTREPAALSALNSNNEQGWEDQPRRDKISPAVVTCVEKWLYFIDFFKEEEKRSMYNHSTGEDELWLSSAHGPNGRDPLKPGFRTCIGLWCMGPELAFNSAFVNCRSVILASGTLCPVETLKTELGFKFHSQMEGDHVVPTEQIFASVLPVGPSGHKLCATFRNYGDENSQFISELALVIRSICMLVPKGILCFFPSYRMLAMVYDFMERTSILRQVVVKEPRRSSDLHMVMEEYESAVSNPALHGEKVDGGLMLAVFRGKVSEGLDFSDDLARVVIAVGIPFPNAFDELVKEKKNYNDLHCKTKSLLSGEQWYVSQAYRAINQALGRCLRHKDDWGALVLVDVRLIGQASKADRNDVSPARVSKWIRKHLVVYSCFEEFEASLSDFVCRMQLNDKKKCDQSSIIL